MGMSRVHLSNVGSSFVLCNPKKQTISGVRFVLIPFLPSLSGATKGKIVIESSSGPVC